MGQEDCELTKDIYPVEIDHDRFPGVRDGYGCGGWRVREASGCNDPECEPVTLLDCHRCLAERVYQHLINLKERR